MGRSVKGASLLCCLALKRRWRTEMISTALMWDSCRDLPLPKPGRGPSNALSIILIGNGMARRCFTSCRSSIALAHDLIAIVVIKLGCFSLVVVWARR